MEFDEQRPKQSNLENKGIYIEIQKIRVFSIWVTNSFQSKSNKQMAN